ncbi:MAG TPA: hypothetical protein VNO70_04105 [Blastocatellia bacterium]|nr:hypothetical protein [Blastocatellia bacterium]
MSARKCVQASFLLFWIPCAWVGLVVSQSSAYGPEVRAYINYLRDEEAELEFQIRHNEISRKEYTRARNRIAILRQTVLDIAKKTGEDRVPEIYVIPAATLDQYIEEGMKALKGVKPGGIVAERWLYIGRVVRGEPYYIFERLSRK